MLTKKRKANGSVEADQSAVFRVRRTHLGS